MISKIARYNDSIRTTKKKDMHSYLEKQKEANAKVSTDNTVEQIFEENTTNEQVADFYIAEYYKSIPQRLNIIKSANKEE